MAKGKTKYKYKTKKVYAKARGGGGSFKPMIDGGLAGLIGQIATKWLGAYGHPVATLGVGYFRNNTTLKTEGARELGALLATKIPLLGGGTSPYAGANY